MTEALPNDSIGLVYMPLFYPGIFILFAAVELALINHSDDSPVSRGRMTVNFGLPLAILPLVLVLPFSVAESARWASDHTVGLFNHFDVPWLLVLAAALIMRTGLGYLVHRLSHSIPLLWRLHRIHHADKGFDVSLGLRHHPLEIPPPLVVYSAGTILLGLPLWSVVISEVALMVASITEHINVRLPPVLGRWLGLVLVTPAVHRVHHSTHKPQTDSNFSPLFTIWDRLFGTYRNPEDESVAQIGLSDVDESRANNLVAQLMLPFYPLPAVALSKADGVERP